MSLVYQNNCLKVAKTHAGLKSCVKWLLGCTLLFYTCTASAQDNRDILSVLENQTTDWNRGAIEAYMEGYWRSDSLLFVGRNGPTYGWQHTLDNYKKAYPTKEAMGKLTMNIIKIDFLDKKNVFVLGRWRVNANDNASEGYFTLLMRYIDGMWKIVADHTSG